MLLNSGLQANILTVIYMELTKELKKRFCKDMNIPILLHIEPYFQSRIDLYEGFFNIKESYKEFQKICDEFESVQKYFEYYNKIKDDAIKHLKSKEGLKRFTEDDSILKPFVNSGFSSHDIFKSNFDGKHFISVDMEKANFTSLRYYDPSIVDNKSTYEEFIGQFTDFSYFKKSKYIRQVIFGNLNPRRQVAYEKRLMDGTLTDILKFTEANDIVYFSNDEIVIDVTNKTKDRENYIKILDELMNKKQLEGIRLRFDVFELKRIIGIEGYIRKFSSKLKYDFKCVNSLLMPFVLRACRHEDPIEMDHVFMFEGMLANLLETPNIQIV